MRIYLTTELRKRKETKKDKISKDKNNIIQHIL